VAEKHLLSFAKVFASTVKGLVLNKNTVFIFLAGVAFYLVFYSWTIYNQQIEHIPAAVVDLDNTAASRRLIMEMDASPFIDVLFVTQSESEAMDAFRRDIAPTVVTIPTDYQKHLARGENVTINVLGNGAFPAKPRAAEVGLKNIVADGGGKADLESVFGSGLSGTSLVPRRGQPPGTASAYRFNEIGGYANYCMPVIAPIILQAVMMMGLCIGIGGWLCATPRPRFVSQALRHPLTSGLAVYLGVWMIIFMWFFYIEGFDFWVFEYTTLSNLPLTLLAGLLLSADIAAASIAVALMLGSNHWALQTVALASAPSVFVSGGIWPQAGITNPVVFVFSQFLPSTPGIQMMVSASQGGAPLSELLPQLWLCLAQIGLYLLLCCRLARWRATHFNRS
jgi:hypothetical protein